MTRDVDRLSLDDFERLLDAYGGDPGRWPEQRRADALAFVGESPAAARALAEARAFDEVLARASGPDPARLQPLADRIFAAALAAPPAAADPRPSARVIALPTRRSAAALSRPEIAPRQPRPLPVVREPLRGWRSATALAASLMLGVMIGVSDLAPTSAFGLSPSVEAQAGDTEAVLAALQANGLLALDEDEI